MIWKCPACQTEYDILNAYDIRYCPTCGTANVTSNAQEKKSSASAKNTNCPVCCTEIQEGDETIVCPECKMAYHKDCWEDNKGCATYGCPQAGCLNPPPMNVDVTGAPAVGVPAPHSVGTKSFFCPKCQTPLEADATFCWSCGTDLGNSALVSADVPLAGPWARWAARLIDFTLETLVCGFILGAIFNFADVPDAIAGMIAAPFAFLLDSAVHAIFGNTLGKWLWGIKHIETNGMGISGGRYFSRNIRVYWGGYGLGIPIVTLCTFVTQYNRVSKGEPSTYDESMGIKTVRPNPNAFKSFWGVIVTVGIFILLVVLRTAGK